MNFFSPSSLHSSFYPCPLNFFPDLSEMDVQHLHINVATYFQDIFTGLDIESKIYKTSYGFNYLVLTDTTCPFYLQTVWNGLCLNISYSESTYSPLNTTTRVLNTIVETSISSILMYNLPG